MKIGEWLKTIGLTADSDINIPGETVSGNTTTETPPATTVTVESEAKPPAETNTAETDKAESNGSAAEQLPTQAELMKQINELKAANLALMTRMAVEAEPSVDEMIYNLCVGGNQNGNNQSVRTDS